MMAADIWLGSICDNVVYSMINCMFLVGSLCLTRAEME